MGGGGFPSILLKNSKQIKIPDYLQRVMSNERGRGTNVVNREVSVYTARILWYKLLRSQKDINPI